MAVPTTQQKAALIAAGLMALLQTGCAHEQTTNTKSKFAPASTSHKVVSDTFQLTEGSILKTPLDTVIVKSMTLDCFVQATGQLQANANAVTRISSPITGRVIKVSAAVGDQVKSEQTMLVLSSQEIAGLETELFKSETEIESELSKDLLEIDCDLDQAEAQLGLYKKQYERAKLLNEEKITALADLEAAKTMMDKQALSINALKQKKQRLEQTAERKKSMDRNSFVQRLKLLGMPPHTIETILNNHTLDTQIPICTPMSGIVLERQVNTGELIDPGKTLFVVDDLDNLWLVAEIFEQDIDTVKVGQKIEFSVDSFPHQVFKGTLNHVAGAINPETRTLAVRAEVVNPGLKLKPKMFARMKIFAGHKEALCVPKTALQEAGSKKVVYVALPDDTFREAIVETGEETGDYVEIRSGLKQGERIVTSGAFNLRAHVLKWQRTKRS